MKLLLIVQNFVVCSHQRLTIWNQTCIVFWTNYIPPDVRVLNQQLSRKLKGYNFLWLLFLETSLGQGNGRDRLSKLFVLSVYLLLLINCLLNDIVIGTSITILQQSRSLHASSCLSIDSSVFWESVHVHGAVVQGYRLLIHIHNTLPHTFCPLLYPNDALGALPVLSLHGGIIFFFFLGDYNSTWFLSNFVLSSSCSLPFALVLVTYIWFHNMPFGMLSSSSVAVCHWMKQSFNGADVLSNNFLYLRFIFSSASSGTIAAYGGPSTES